MSKGTHPTIAQLAERETVEVKQLSLGHWFESGWSETFLIENEVHFLTDSKFQNIGIELSSSRICNFTSRIKFESEKMKILLNVTKSNKLT